MKKAVLILAVLMLALSSVGSAVRTGQVQGRIVDNQGKPLPGVKVTLSGPSTADHEDRHRRVGGIPLPVRLPGPGLQRQGRADRLQDRRSGPTSSSRSAAASRVDLVLEPGKTEEQVNVTAAPAVDRPEEDHVRRGVRLDGAPDAARRPATPGSSCSSSPAVMLDRENVGGNESGQQSAFVTKGDNTNGANNIWSVDGIDITDPAALGDSALLLRLRHVREI